MPQEFQYFFNVSITFREILTNISVALVCGLIISVFYRFTYRGAGYAVSYLNSLVILPIITAIVIMVIGNNLARAFGLVGAMSIIRFRTAVKETLDIIYIFFALAIGMAAGVAFHSLAFAGTFIVGCVLVVLTKTNISTASKDEYLLQFYYDENGLSDEAAYMNVINKYSKKYQLINVKSAGSSNGVELSYYIRLKSKSANADFVRELKGVPGLNHVNLFFDEEHY